MAKKITGFSLDEDVLEGIKKLAKKEERSISNYVNILLAKHLKGSDYNPPAQRKGGLIRRKK